MSVDRKTDDRHGATRGLRVVTVFHLDDDRQAQEVAARMIDSAHEIANLPECECDVDISVEVNQPDVAFGSAGAPERVDPVEN